jgi:hypothetical protein
MYFDHPHDEAAYRVPNQFLFGDRLLVAPITAPADRATQLGAVRAWLPAGRWTDVFTGLVYRGDTMISLHRDLDSIPVLAPAGAILPLTAADVVGFGTPVPDALELRVYAGADGEFELAEDGDDECWALTRFTLAGDELRILPVSGDLGSVPPTRRYDVVLCGFADLTGVEVDGRVRAVTAGPVPGSVSVRLGAVAATNGVVLRLVGDTTAAGNPDVPERLFALLDRAQIALATKDAAHRALTGQDPSGAVLSLAALELDRPLFDALVELLLAHPAG